MPRWRPPSDYHNGSRPHVNAGDRPREGVPEVRTERGAGGPAAGADRDAGDADTEPEMVYGQHHGQAPRDAAGVGIVPNEVPAGVLGIHLCCCVGSQVGRGGETVRRVIAALGLVAVLALGQKPTPPAWARDIKFSVSPIQAIGPVYKFSGDGTLTKDGVLVPLTDDVREALLALSSAYGITAVTLLQWQARAVKP